MSIEIKGIDFEKIGFDSSSIICLAVDPRNLNHFKANFCSFSKKYYFSVESEAETIGVLINKYSFSPSESRALWKKVCSEINLNLICWGKDLNERGSFFKIVREINNSLSNNGKDATFFIGDMDVQIISNFYSEEIRKIYTLDRAFKKTCKELGIITLKMPKEYLVRMEKKAK
ncbi:hypothetical protein HOD29_01625 [archaeon]|jgi:hypothetical protein|nr:hypothetical protein [archaeon]